MAEVRGLILGYLTATPNGELSVWMVGKTVNAPVAGVIEYCETVLPPSAPVPKFATNIQLLSRRMVMETGPAPVATVAGDSDLSEPDTGLIARGDMVLESTPSTYTLLP